ADETTAAGKVFAQTLGLEDGHQAAPVSTLSAPSTALATESQQRTLRPSLSVACGGSRLRQRSMTRVQRGAKAHPGASIPRSGGCPSMAVSRRRLSLRRGIELSSAWV